jgi:VanZ family protein
MLYAFTDELHQHFVPGRSVEFADWVADSHGAAAGVALYLITWRSRLRAKNDLAAPSAESRSI